MGAAVDPTYPLYPIACMLASAMLLLVLLTSFIHQSWNLGVAFLCFWLYIENITSSINHIMWADNADIKAYVYCDIVSHMQLITFVVKPMATLIIIRRLHLIASLKSIELPDETSRRRNLAIEWTLGLVVPALVAGPLYYVVQWMRFQVDEGFGCGNAPDNSVLSILLLNCWPVTLPMITIVLYYPRVMRVFYRHSQDINRFLQSNNSVSRTNYFRILALASIDVLLTLPIGITTIILAVTQELSFSGPIPFYWGWTYDHDPTAWAPGSYTYAEIVSDGTSNVAGQYFTQWTSPILAFVIFALFGVTSEARASYWRTICTICGWFGYKPKPWTRKARSPELGTMEFGTAQAPQDVPYDLEMGSRPSFIDTNVRTEVSAQEFRRGQGSATDELEGGSVKEVEEEDRVSPSNARYEDHTAEQRRSQWAESVDPSNSV